MTQQLPHTEHVEEILARARELEREAADVQRLGELFARNGTSGGERDALLERARQLRHEASESHNAHVAAELERAKSEPINLSDLLAGREAFTLDEIESKRR